jgi:hypothetical protein
MPEASELSPLESALKAILAEPPQPPPAPPPLRPKVLILGPEGCGKSTLVRRLVEGRFVSRVGATVGVDFCVWTAPAGSAASGAATAAAAAAAAAAAVARDVCLQVFDVSGAPAYAPLRSEFFRADTGLHAALLCFDAGDRASFDALGACVAEARAGGLALGAGPAGAPRAASASGVGAGGGGGGSGAGSATGVATASGDATAVAAALAAMAPAAVKAVVCACKTDVRPRAVAGDEARAWAEARGMSYVEASASLGIGHEEAFQLLAEVSSSHLTRIDNKDR